MAWIFTSDGNYVNFNGGGNLWRLHKDSNCISWHWDETGDLFFDVYDQEYTVKAASIGDVIIDGTPLTTASDFKTAIEAMFPGLAGGGGILSATVTLNDTQIKALPTTPVEIVAAPGAGKIILIFGGFCVLYNSAAAYAGTTNASWQLFYGDNLSSITSPVDTNSILSNAGTSFLQMAVPSSQAPNAGVFSGEVISALTTNLSNVANRNVAITDLYNGLSDYTGGNAANTLQVTVYYVVVDL